MDACPTLTLVKRATTQLTVDDAHDDAIDRPGYKSSQDVNSSEAGTINCTNLLFKERIACTQLQHGACAMSAWRHERPTSIAARCQVGHDHIPQPSCCLRCFHAQDRAAMSKAKASLRTCKHRSSRRGSQGISGKVYWYSLCTTPALPFRRADPFQCALASPDPLHRRSSARKNVHCPF